MNEVKKEKKWNKSNRINKLKSLSVMFVFFVGIACVIYMMHETAQQMKTNIQILTEENNELKKNEKLLREHIDSISQETEPGTEQEAESEMGSEPEEDNETEQKQVESFFGKHTVYAATDFKFEELTDEAIEGLGANYTDAVASGLVELMEENQISNINSATFVRKLYVSAEANAYLFYLGNDSTQQVSVMYYPTYNEYLFLLNQEGQENQVTEGSHVTETEAGTENGEETSAETEESETEMAASYNPETLTIRNMPETLVNYMKDPQVFRESLASYLYNYGYQEVESCELDSKYDIDVEKGKARFEIILDNETVLFGIYDKGSDTYVITQ